MKYSAMSYGSPSYNEGDSLMSVAAGFMPFGFVDWS